MGEELPGRWEAETAEGVSRERGRLQGARPGGSGLLLKAVGSPGV